MTPASRNLDEVKGRPPERRRLARLNLSTEQFKHDATGKLYTVADLSIGGMAFRVSEDDEKAVFPVGTQLKGTLNIRRQKIRVVAKVRHVGPDLVGCEFGELDPDVRGVIEKFLDPVELGKELKPLPPPESGAIWYHGPSGTDLLVWRARDGQFRKLSFYLLGCFVQWSPEEGLSTGRASPSDTPGELRGVLRLETLLLEADLEPDQAKLSVAKKLLLSSNLPQDLKKWVSRVLDQSA